MGKFVIYAVFAILLLMALVAVVVGALIGGGGGSRSSNIGGTFGPASEYPSGPVVGTTPRVCNGPPNARQYQQLFAQAAAQHLGGDQAMLLALIEQESGFNRYSVAGSSTAAGMAQFITSTARSKAEFVGGADGAGKTWPTGIVYDRASQERTPDDARFDPERSIFAAARLLGHYLNQRVIAGDLYKAYFMGYHTGGRYAVGSPQYNEGQRGATALVRRYRRIASQFCTSATSYRILEIFKGVV